MNRLFIIIAMLICTSQVVSLFTALQDFHQIDAQHLSTQHQHSDDHTINKDTHSSEDCHHCGHCSGTHLNLALLKADEAPVSDSQGEHYLEPQKKRLLRVESHHRPPIHLFG
ncbi:hypothetical protein ACSLBF_18170 (plasmid) [Pseudoalteromonas sp. T1lg65]|uniref:hypothetical protein n=1 Tax=Pseudoalteromonas sp. T1lg65 TaxID=2077101 RepID=UPI003F78CDEE